MSNARNLARLVVDSNGDVAASSLDNVVGLPDAIDVNASAPADSLVINSSGNLLVGASSSDLASSTKSLVIGSDGFGVQYGGAEGTYVKIVPGAANGNVDFKFDARSGNYPAATFWTSNTERMRIDSSGRVTMPYQPAFMASKGDDNGQIAAGTYVFNQVTLNVGSCYNSSNGRFTAPVTGVYYFLTRLQLYGSTVGSVNVNFKVNGSIAFGSGNVETYDEVPNSTSHSAPHHGGLILLNAGDYVEVYRGYATRGMQSSFFGYLIG